MIVLVVVLLMLVAGLSVLLVVLWRERARHGVLERRQRMQWVISLKSGDAFRGVLTDHDGTSIVLSNAEHYADPTTPVPVDGEVFVLLGDVKYAQRL